MKSLSPVWIGASLLIASPSLAAEAPGCGLSQVLPESVTYLPKFPTYFFKPLPRSSALNKEAPNHDDYLDGQWYGYSGTTNYLIRRDNTGAVMVTPGNYDLVPTPEGEFLIIPTKSIPKSPTLTEKVAGITFYRTSALMKAAKAKSPGGMGYSDLSDQSAKYAYREDIDDGKALVGTYVTLGSANPVSQESRRVYRAIAEKPAKFGATGPEPSQLQMREFIAEFSRGDGSAKISPVSAAKPVCRGLKLKLPMISKTGKFIGALDVTNPKNPTTKIYQVDEAGNCKAVLDLGLKTGKIDFNYNDTRIAFHLDTYRDSWGELNEWFSGISNLMTKNIFVVDIVPDGNSYKLSHLRRLSSVASKGMGNYYPNFIPGGLVVSMSVRKVSGSGKVYRFETVNPSKGNYQEYGFKPAGGNEAQFALGSLWNTVCQTGSRNGLNANDLAAFSLSMNPSECKKLVSSYWSKKKTGILASSSLAKFKALSESAQLEKLAQACPSVPNNAGFTPVAVAGKPTPVIGSPLQVFTANCKGCHQGITSKYFDSQLGRAEFKVAKNIRYSSLVSTADAEKPRGEIKLSDLLAVLNKTNPRKHYPRLVTMKGPGNTLIPPELLSEEERAVMERDLKLAVEELR